MPRWVRLLGQAGLTAGVLVALLAVVDRSAVYEAVRQARWPWLGLAVGLLPVNLALDGWVWSRLLRIVDVRLSGRTLTRALLSGFSLGFWTPVRAGEFVGRAWSVPGENRWTLSLGVLAQRMLDMGVGVGVGLGLLLWALHAQLLPTSSGWLIAAGVGAGTVAILAAGVVAPRRVVEGLDGLLGEWGSFSTRTALFRRHSPHRLGPALGGTVARYLVFTGQFVCLARAMAPTASLATLGLAVGLTFYAKYLIPSLTLLDLGIREGGAVFFFSLLGLPPAAGLGASLLLFVINVLAPAAAGVPALWRLSLPGHSPAEGDPAPAVADS